MSPYQKGEILLLLLFNNYEGVLTKDYKKEEKV